MRGEAKGLYHTPAFAVAAIVSSSAVEDVSFSLPFLPYDMCSSDDDLSVSAPCARAKGEPEVVGMKGDKREMKGEADVDS